MCRFAFLQRSGIDGFEGKSEVVSLLSAPDYVVGQVVYLDLLVFLRIDDVVLTIKSQLFLLPHPQTVRSRIGLADDEAFILDRWWS